MRVDVLKVGENFMIYIENHKFTEQFMIGRAGLNLLHLALIQAIHRENMEGLRAYPDLIEDENPPRTSAPQNTAYK